MPAPTLIFLGVGAVSVAAFLVVAFFVEVAFGGIQSNGKGVGAISKFWRNPLDPVRCVRTNMMPAC